jgi:hypothetical protein
MTSSGWVPRECGVTATEGRLWSGVGVPDRVDVEDVMEPDKETEAFAAVESEGD